MKSVKWSKYAGGGRGEGGGGVDDQLPTFDAESNLLKFQSLIIVGVGGWQSTSNF